MILLTIFLAALSPEQACEIGLKVWMNECAGTLDGLLSWNEGEEFASLGIGHFIWYPHGRSGPYVETFPALLKHLKANGVVLPRWLEEARAAPWKNRAEFLKAKSNHKASELKRLLKETVGLQTQFLSQRLENGLPELSEKAPAEKKEQILARYRKILADRRGTYALLDYINFKGYGTAEKERYVNEGWGLLQVLDNMSDEGPALEQFVASAKRVLEKRVFNAPSERNERRYLKGWFARLDSYQSD